MTLLPPIDPISFLCKQWLQHGVLLHVRVSISSANEHVSISSTNDFGLLGREEFQGSQSAIMTKKSILIFLWLSKLCKPNSE